MGFIAQGMVMRRITLILQSLMFAFTMLAGCNTTTVVANQGQSEERTFPHDGIERNYSIYIPKTINNSKPLPLLIALHGGRGSAKKWPRYTNYGFERLADREHFILWPEGWRAGCPE
jgi:polyhydroxybutyrate depolymerase